MTDVTRILSALERLSRLRLKRLYVANANVTDVGLTALHQCQTLRVLDVSRTRASVDGVAKLRKALPDCEAKADELRK
jgi:hypothetical protein